MGQASSSRRQFVVRTNVFESSPVTTQIRGVKSLQLRRLIISGKLAPCNPGQDDNESGKVSKPLFDTPKQCKSPHVAQLLYALL